MNKIGVRNRKTTRCNRAAAGAFKNAMANPNHRNIIMQKLRMIMEPHHFEAFTGILITNGIIAITDNIWTE